MNRRLIVGERVMYVNADTPVNCVFAVRIRGIVRPENLRIALDKLQKKHELLRVRLVEDEKGVPHFITNETSPRIPVRVVDRQSDQQWETVSQQEWHTRFELVTGPLMRVVWLKSDDVSDLILVCPHCICDGATFVSLLRETLDVLDNPQLELSPSYAFHSISELLPDTYAPDWKDRVKASLLAGIAKAFFWLKRPKKNTTAGESYLIHWKLDPKETTELRNRCKQEGITVHAALCVAFIDAFRSVKQEKARGKVICPVDIRRYVPRLKNDTMFAFAPIVELSLKKEQSGTFWQKAQLLKEELAQKLKAININDLLTSSEYFHGSVVKMTDFLKVTEGSHDITLSNMGRLNIPEQYTTFTVETIYSPTVAFPWRNANTVVISWFRGEMDFSFFSNDAFLSQDEAHEIADNVLDLLSTEMALA